MIRNVMLSLSVLSLLICFSINASEKPNIIFILVDDMGWSDLGCYGGEIDTPNIDSLAEGGLRFTQFYNTAKCMPSRACLLTGIYAHQNGMSRRPKALINSITLGEALQPAGYRTFASGKHHGTENLYERGFDHYYGLRDGACNFWNPGKQRSGESVPGSKGRIRYWCDDEKTYAPYTPEDRNFYATDVFTDKPLEWLDEKELDEQPFFLYLAYNAPHYPLHAHPKDIEKYKGKYDAGYNVVREARYQRMIDIGLIDPEKNSLPKWRWKDWDSLPDLEREKEKRRMEIYAAMLDSVDQNIGRIIKKLKEQGKYENTVIMFASDNGGCAEPSGAKYKSDKLEDFGSLASYETVGEGWATVQNTPLRKWKNFSQEGGIRTPFILSWPGKIKKPGSFVSQPLHLIDVMPTVLEMANAGYPEVFDGEEIISMQGMSFLPLLLGETVKREKPLFWEWAKGGAIREGDLKAVFWGKYENDKNGKTKAKNWELYDISKDRNEMNNLAAQNPKVLKRLSSAWEKWFKEVSVYPK